MRNCLAYYGRQLARGWGDLVGSWRGGTLCGADSLLMSPAPQATNESRPAALIDVKKLETPRSSSRLPAASPEPLPPLTSPAALFTSFTPPFHFHQLRQGEGSGG